MDFSQIISWFGDEFDLQLIITNLIHLLIAFVFALPVAWNRERTTRSAGLRTFPLVSIASCAYMLIGISIFESGDAVARVAYGIVTGMGFIGGGAILKSKGNVMGTATAASIWNTGAIGVSVAFKLYEVGILLAIINFLILRFADPLKKPEEEKKGTQDDVGTQENNND
jgi:putative Mg2+ transporter-C (MgtC) family protein